MYEVSEEEYQRIVAEYERRYEEKAKITRWLFTYNEQSSQYIKQKG